MKNLKILLAIDGYEQSMNAVRYAGAIFPSDQTEVVLYHVKVNLPESFMDLGKKSNDFYEEFPIKAWRVQQKKDVDRFMQTANEILLEDGFPAESIKTKVQAAEVGITRDILAESFQGFDAVVVGRNGINQLRDIVIGSVAAKLIEKTYHVPIIVVGGKPSPGKIIVAYDGSEKAEKAVDMVGSLLGRSNCSIKLCQAVRPLNLNLPEEKFIFLPKHESKWEVTIKKQITPSLKNAQKRLINAGLAPERLSYEILTGKLSRAGNIVEKAKKDDFGTIVIGRRGFTIVEEFTSGRVTRKVLDMSSKFAVWIIN